MNEQKQYYLIRIRAQTAYPWIRRIATFVQYACYSIAVFFAVSSSVGYIVVSRLTGSGLGFLYIAVSIIVAALIAIIGAVTKEASVMLADIADSVTDLNCRYEQ